MEANWVDAVIVAILIYELKEGWFHGATRQIASFVSFALSFWIAVRFHTVIGAFFEQKFGIATIWVDTIGYLIAAMLSQVILEALFTIVLDRLPQKFHTSKLNHWLGSLLSFANALVIVSFFLILILELPMRGAIKQDIQRSWIGKQIIFLSDRMGGNVRENIENLSRSITKFMTVEPGSREQISLELPTKPISLTTQYEWEQQMTSLVNSERTKRGLAPLRFDEQVAIVARGKSKDMFERRYFSHYDPDGKNAADRLDAANVTYRLVGENLAFSPDIKSAHEGLMNSEGHRANILDTRFHVIGVGVISGGIYGTMFTQIFTD